MHLPFSNFHFPLNFHLKNFSTGKLENKRQMVDGRWKIQAGISLIEILVVVTIFAILGILVTRSVILTLQGSQKSVGLVSVRENLDYSMSIIERQIRNADAVDCVNSTGTNLIYTDQYGRSSTFSCNGSTVASGSGILTNDAVRVTGCTFTCVAATSTNQPYVDISLTGQSATLTGAQNSSVTTNTRIYLRDY